VCVCGMLNLCVRENVCMCVCVHVCVCDILNLCVRENVCCVCVCMCAYVTF